MTQDRPGISTHVLDTGLGMPRSGVGVRLSRIAADGAEVEAGSGVTDSDGRVGALLSDELTPGDYRLHFDLGAEGAGFFLAITIDLRVEDVSRGYHVPLLVAPFGLSTYRGS